MRWGHVVPRGHTEYGPRLGFSSIPKSRLCPPISPVQESGPTPRGPRAVDAGFVWPGMLTPLLQTRLTFTASVKQEDGRAQAGAGGEGEAERFFLEEKHCHSRSSARRQRRRDPEGGANEAKVRETSGGQVKSRDGESGLSGISVNKPRRGLMSFRSSGGRGGAGTP